MYKLINYSHTIKEFAKVDDLYCNVSNIKWDYVVAELSSNIPNDDFETMNDVITYIDDILLNTSCMSVCINGDECKARFVEVKEVIKRLIH